MTRTAVATATRCVIYLRISDDKLGREAGVARQREACKAEATRRGFTVVEVVTDNDRSASEYATKVRDGYAKVRRLVDAGSVDAVIAWSSDRLHRRTDELDAWIKRTHGNVATIYVQGGEADYRSAAGKLMARQTGAFASYESDVRSERITAAMAQMRELGQWAGPAAFGWTWDNVEANPGRWVRRFTGKVDPVEGAAIVTACADLMAGKSLSAIARDWEAAGLTTTRGTTTWNTTAVRQILRRASNAALMETRGKVVGAGNWDAIVDEPTWRAVRSLLDHPARRTNTSVGNVHMGAGIYLCGVCGAKVRSQAAYYRCKATGHVMRASGTVDTLVAKHAAAALSNVRPVRRRPVDANDPAAERDRLVAKLAEISADYANDAITRDERDVARNIVQGKLDKLADAVLPDPARDLILATGPMDADGFMALPLATRRMIVARAMDVVIHKDRVAITPKPL